MTLEPVTATANHIDGRIHVEFQTAKGKQTFVLLPAGAEQQFLNDVEDAVLDQQHHRDKGAAGPWDPGAAA